MGQNVAGLPHMTTSFNLAAFIGILAVTVILVIGIKESANVNTAIVAVKKPGCSLHWPRVVFLFLAAISENG